MADAFVALPSDRWYGDIWWFDGYLMHSVHLVAWVSDSLAIIAGTAGAPFHAALVGRGTLRLRQDPPTRG